MSCAHSMRGVYTNLPCTNHTHPQRNRNQPDLHKIQHTTRTSWYHGDMSERYGRPKKERISPAELVRRVMRDRNAGDPPLPVKIDTSDVGRVGRHTLLAATLAHVAPATAFAQSAPHTTTQPTTVRSPSPAESARLKSLIQDVAPPHTVNIQEGHVSDDDISCLIKNIYHEARGEPDRGQLAVALVTLARSQDRRFANTVCGVVYQKNQYSWTREVELMEKGPPEEYQANMRALLDMLITGKKYNDAIGLLAHMLSLPKGTLYYKRTDWSHEGTADKRMSEKSKAMWRKLTRVGEIGNHTFYTD